MHLPEQGGFYFIINELLTNFTATTRNDYKKSSQHSGFAIYA